jgi:molybdate/tungstate transport system substrate-binding protein
MHRRTVLLAGAALPLIHGLASAQSATPKTANVGTVNVLYAGSLVNLMERGIGPAFDKSTHGWFEGYAGGSNKLANEIKGELRQGDVFVSADPRVNDHLMGPPNGSWVSWYVTFARSPLVIGYNPASRFAAALETQPWYDVLRRPGIRLGRTDPQLDPKGQLTIALLQQAEQIYRQPGLALQVLGAPGNPAQVFPEEILVGRLQSGQLDAGFFYATETADLGIPPIALPPETTPSAHYTATVLRGAPNPAGAAHFLAFLLGTEGSALMRQHGLEVVPPAISGDAGKAPPEVRSALHATK